MRDKTHKTFAILQSFQELLDVHETRSETHYSMHCYT
jgi:hypothetical protein